MGQRHFSFVFLFGENSKTVVGKIEKSVLGVTFDTIVIEADELVRNIIESTSHLSDEQKHTDENGLI